MSALSKPVTRGDTKVAAKSAAGGNLQPDPCNTGGGNIPMPLDTKSDTSGARNELEEKTKSFVKKSGRYRQHTFDNEKLVPPPKLHTLVITKPSWRCLRPEWELYKNRGGTLRLVNLFTDRQLRQIRYLGISLDIPENELLAALDQNFLFYTHVTEVLSDMQHLPAPKLGTVFDDVAYEELHCMLEKIQKMLQHAGVECLPVKSFVKSQLRRLFLTSGFIGRILWNHLEGIMEDESVQYLDSREMMDKIAESLIEQFGVLRPHFDVVKSASLLGTSAGRWQNRTENVIEEPNGRFQQRSSDEEVKQQARGDNPIAKLSYASMAVEDAKQVARDRDDKTVTKPSYASVAAKSHQHLYQRKPYNNQQARTVVTTIKHDEHEVGVPNPLEVKDDHVALQDREDDVDRDSIFDLPSIRRDDHYDDPGPKSTDDLLEIRVDKDDHD